MLFLKNVSVPVNFNTLRKLMISSFAAIPINRFFFLGKKYKIRFTFCSYQNEATEHDCEENEPLQVLVFHKTSNATPEL